MAFAGAPDVDYAWGIERPNALNADATNGNFANGKTFAQIAPRNGDQHTFKDLGSFFVAFFDLLGYFERIADPKVFVFVVKTIGHTTKNF